MQNEYFSPPELAPLFGVNVSTIKRWADKGYLPTERTSGGHRRITKNNLEKFIEKHPNHSKNSYVLRRLLDKKNCPDADCWKKYYSLLKKNENSLALKLLEQQYLSGSTILNILSIVVTPTMRHISKEWTTGNISVYEEHRMTFNMRSHLLRLDQFIPDKSSGTSPCAILACAPGEFFELPLQLVAIILKMHNWRVHILGVNIPINELLNAAKKIKPELMAITKTYTKNEAPSYFKKLFAFADKHDVCLASGGDAWKKKFSQKSWRGPKCAHYFPALKEFDRHLRGYKRKR